MTCNSMSWRRSKSQLCPAFCAAHLAVTYWGTVLFLFLLFFLWFNRTNWNIYHALSICARITQRDGYLDVARQRGPVQGPAGQGRHHHQLWQEARGVEILRIWGVLYVCVCVCVRVNFLFLSPSLSLSLSLYLSIYLSICLSISQNLCTEYAVVQQQNTQTYISNVSKHRACVRPKQKNSETPAKVREGRALILKRKLNSVALFTFTSCFSKSNLMSWPASSLEDSVRLEETGFYDDLHEFHV